MDMNTSEQNVTAGSILMPGLVDLQKFMFSDRYHLTASALAQVCPLMTVLMLWTTSFNRCRASLLSLVLNAFLKVRVVYFKADFTISGTFQRSTCSAGATPTCTPYTISFLGVEGPFLEEVGPFMVFWCNCCLAGCVIAFSQLLKRFSSLIARLIALQQWDHFSFLIVGSQWCCFSAVSLEKNLVHLLHLWLVLSIKHSISCSISRTSWSVTVNMASSWSSVKAFVQPVLVDLIWKERKSSLITRANIQIYRHDRLRKKKEAGLCET